MNKAGIYLILMAALLLNGCWDRTEINDLALITAVAIDQAKDQTIELSVQMVIPRQIGGGQSIGEGSSGDQYTIVRTEYGSNIADALSKLQSVVPRKIFWGQCKVFIFGEALAKDGIQESMDFLVRHPQTRERANVYVSKGKAAKILFLSPPMERSSAEVLRELSNLAIGIRVTLNELNLMLSEEPQTAILPYVHILPAEKGLKELQTIPYLIGAAIFQNDKMIGQISEKTTRGVLWLRDEIQEYTATFQSEKIKGSVSLKPVKATVKFIPIIEHNKWKLTILVLTKGDIIQNGTFLNPIGPNIVYEFEQAFEKDVKDRIELALREVQHNMKTDVFHFAKAFYRKYPKQWLQVKDRWNTLFPQIEVDIVVKAIIVMPGLVGPPGGMPTHEVIQP